MNKVEPVCSDGNWRLIDSETGMIAVHELTGKPLDGGGHGDDKEKTERQAKHINDSLQRKAAETRRAHGGGLQDA